MKDTTGLDGSAPSSEVPPATPDPLRVPPPLDAIPTVEPAARLRRAGNQGEGRRGTTHGRASDSWSTRERGHGRR